MKLISVSGKYRGNVAENIHKAREAAIQVWKMRHVALTPHLNTIHFENDCGIPDDWYITGDLIMLERVDGILMLEGWKESEGARIEHDFAVANGIPIYYDIRDIPKPETCNETPARIKDDA